MEHSQFIAAERTERLAGVCTYTEAIQMQIFGCLMRMTKRKSIFPREHTAISMEALNKMAAEAQIPTKFGGSSSTYVRAAFFSPGGAGVSAPWRFGNLSVGGACGLPCALGAFGPGYSAWYGVPRLAGSGKKRGEWPA